MIRLICILTFLPLVLHGQETISEKSLFDLYDQFKEESIDQRRFKHRDIIPLIDAFGESLYVSTVGKSIEGRSIKMISLGNGPVNVLLWSQMHGDEPTATMAIMDLLNFFTDDSSFTEWKKTLLSKVTIHFIPMLNPDGAERFQRRNALGIDLNRDALRLQCPESRILKRVRDSLDADWGFNLHDQNRYYSAGRNPLTASISFLAPAFNYEKEINQTRGDAMRLIALMNDRLQHYIPGKVGRYSDEFEPRAFGDNIQKWGTRTILIESGGLENDREKQYLRKLHFVVLLMGLDDISSKTYSQTSLNGYHEIPMNDSYAFHDLILRNATVEVEGQEFMVDVAIRQQEVDYNDAYNFSLKASISDLGDLSTSFGYEEYDLTGHTLEPGMVYPKVISGTKDIKNLNTQDIVKRGYTYIMSAEAMKIEEFESLPLAILGRGCVPSVKIAVGENPALICKKGGIVKGVLINGQFFELD